MGETVEHLFMNCGFIRDLWKLIADGVGVQFCWDFHSLGDCLESWSHLPVECKELPYFMIWEVWRTRNLCIFEDVKPFRAGLCFKIIAAYREFTNTVKPVVGMNTRQLKNRLSPPILVFPCGFFDGAATCRNGTGGSGATLHFTCSITVHLWLNLGMGTNTRSEVCALWLLLYWARLRGIHSLVTFGDSSAVISWEKGISPLNVIGLTHWLDAARKLILEFEHIHFEHIYREVNREADMLSKRALHSQAGTIMWQEWRDDTLFAQGSHLLHWT